MYKYQHEVLEFHSKKKKNVIKVTYDEMKFESFA